MDNNAQNNKSDFRKYVDKQMNDPAFREEHEKTRADYEVMRALIAARTSQNITQKELSRRTGIRQSNISRIENGTCSPTVATLKALAEGVGKELHIEFK